MFLHFATIHSRIGSIHDLGKISGAPWEDDDLRTRCTLRLNLSVADFNPLNKNDEHLGITMPGLPAQTRGMTFHLEKCGCSKDSKSSEIHIPQPVGTQKIDENGLPSHHIPEMSMIESKSSKYITKYLSAKYHQISIVCCSLPCLIPEASNATTLVIRRASRNS